MNCIDHYASLNTIIFSSERLSIHFPSEIGDNVSAWFSHATEHVIALTYPRLYVAVDTWCVRQVCVCTRVRSCTSASSGHV